MMNRQIILVDNSINGSTVEGFSPFTMVLSTSAYTSTNKIWKIGYDFGDGYIDERILNLNPNSYNPNLPIPSEPGDPRNQMVEHLYYFDDDNKKSFSITMFFYCIGTNIVEQVSFTLTLTLPKIEDIFESADTIKLVGSRMFGLENQLIYLFESQSPNYLIPVLARF